MSEAATLIREARTDAGLSMRALADRADVSYTTIFRVEHDQIDPTMGTMRKLLGALGEDLEIGRRSAVHAPNLAELVDAWSVDSEGQEWPDFTRLRALLDYLGRRPELAMAAIRPRPAPSGSDFFDNVLAGIAEKIADDLGESRPAWSKRIPGLTAWWLGIGTPRMHEVDIERTPPQLAARRIAIPATSLWRHAS